MARGCVRSAPSQALPPRSCSPALPSSQVARSCAAEGARHSSVARERQPLPGRPRMEKCFQCLAPPVAEPAAGLWGLCPSPALLQGRDRSCVWVRGDAPRVQVDVRLCWEVCLAHVSPCDLCADPQVCSLLIAVGLGESWSRWWPILKPLSFQPSRACSVLPGSTAWGVGSALSAQGCGTGGRLPRSCPGPGSAEVGLRPHEPPGCTPRRPGLSVPLCAGLLLLSLPSLVLVPGSSWVRALALLTLGGLVRGETVPSSLAVSLLLVLVLLSWATPPFSV